MSLTSVYGPYAVKIGDDVIGGITQQAIGCNNTLGGDGASGELFRRIAYLRAQQLAPSFTTKAIDTALVACGALGVSLATKSLVMYSQLWLAGGSRATTGHVSHTMALGILGPQSLSADHQGDATLSFAGLLASADGDTVPVTRGASAELPALAAQDEVFALGAVTIGGIVIAGPRSVSVDFGLKFASEGESSNKYDTLAFLESVEPTITIQTIDLAAVGAAGIAVDGAAATHANTTIVLRKRVHGGDFAGSGDLTITACGMAIATEIFDASHPNRGTIGIELRCTYDGTNNPIVIS
jgi:hypothetical protein